MNPDDFRAPPADNVDRIPKGKHAFIPSDLPPDLVCDTRLVTAFFPADSAALAAAAEINQRVFEETGDLQPTSRTWANVQAFASMNNTFLKRYGVDAVVTGIAVDAGKDTVLVQVSGNLERLFPSVVPEVIVTESGEARVRAFTR